jgi:hypothetical protein
VVDALLREHSWNLEYTDKKVGSLADDIAAELLTEGIPATTAYRQPGSATLGTPEVIITIIVTMAAKAAVVAGLRAIQNTFERHLGGDGDRRTRIILIGETGQRRQFPISLRGLGRDAVKEFITGVINVVEKL